MRLCIRVEKLGAAKAVWIILRPPLDPGYLYLMRGSI
jgi:hypothetical protein